MILILSALSTEGLVIMFSQGCLEQTYSWTSEDIFKACNWLSRKNIFPGKYTGNKDLKNN